MSRKIFGVIVCCGLLAACGERLLPGNETIQMLDNHELATHCQYFASTLIQNKNPLFKEEKQREMLLIKAKNLAAELGADTVVPMPAAFKDRQSFRFYMCDHGNDDNSSTPTSNLKQS